MKRLLACCAIATLVALGAPAQANIVTSLQLQFQSGAAFNGTVTFADGYAGMLDTSGTLSGGSWGTTNFSWTWWAGTGQTNPQDFDGNPSTYEDLLMGGDTEPNWTTYIGLSWFFPVVGSAPVLNLNSNPNPSENYWQSVISGQDLIVSGRFGTTAAPEPGSLALLGFGLAGLAVARRRKQ